MGVAETLRAFAARGREGHVRMALYVLKDTFLALPRDWGGAEARRLHVVHSQEVRDVLGNHPGLAQTVINFRAKVPVLPPILFEDPVACANLAILFNALFADYDVAGVDRAVCDAMKELVGAACDALEASAVGQFDKVAWLATRIVEVVERLGMKHRRVVLVELPIGNSLITKLTAALLRARGFRFEIVRASPSRSDTARAHVRLRTVLSHAVQQVPPQADDLFIYADEWDTGSNFRKIVKLLDVIVKRRTPRAYLLPAGLLSARAKQAATWKGAVSTHDRSAEQLGLRGEDLRVQLPELGTGSARHLPFFWSERDRICGYRKMQLWGAMFSTLDAIVDDLAREPRLLEAARIFLLSEAAESGTDIPNDLASDGQGFAEEFVRWHADYRLVRPRLVELDHPTHAGVVAQIDEALGALTTEQLALVRGRPAYQCIATAIVFIRATHLINPRDRYFFDDHAAAVTPLRGPFARAHRHVFMALVRRCHG